MDQLGCGGAVIQISELLPQVWLITVDLRMVVLKYLSYLRVSFV